METPRTRLTFELSEEMLSSLKSRASLEERTLSGQLRHYVSLGLGVPDESEPARDTTPSLPGIP